MAQTKQFEAIIRRERKDFSPVTSSEKRIIIDNNTGKSVDKTAFFGGSYTYYIVSDSSGVRNVNFTSSLFPVIDDKNRTINISIDVQVNCDAGDEVKVAEALHQIDKFPGNKLDELIETWVWKFIAKSGPAVFIDTFFQNRDALKSYVAAQAKHYAGLNFYAVKCLLDGEHDLTTQHISLKDVFLRYLNSTTEHSYSADINLLIDPVNKINAIARSTRKSQFEELLARELREYFSNRVSIGSAYQDREKVEEEFKSYLDNILAYYGRQAGAILLKKDSAWEPDETLKKNIAVAIEVPEYSKSIEVKNHILITRVDHARYSANKPDNLEEWLENNVKRVVTEVYFGQRYDEVIENSQKLEDEVKRNLETVIEKIGYKLDHFVLIPALKELEELKKIEIHIDDKFITRDYQEVKLVTLLKLRCDRYSTRLKQYINEISTLKPAIESFISDEIKKHIRSIQAQDFYENFDGEDNDKETVREGLHNLLESVLMEMFDAQILYLSFDIGETEKIIEMEELKKRWHKFEVDIESRVDFQVSSFCGWFRVQGSALGRWNIFQPQQFSIDEIRERICEALAARLCSVPSSKLAYQDPKQQAEVESGISDMATKAIIESFGLTIIVRDIRLTNRPDDYVGKAIRELEERIIGVLADGDFERADELDENLERLKKRAGYVLSPAPAAEYYSIEAGLESRNGNNTRTDDDE